MRSPTALEPGRLPALAAFALLAVGLGCADSTSPDPGGVRSVVILVPDTVLRPGTFMQAAAEPRDIDGMPIEGRAVTWRSLTPQTLAVSDQGELLALAPGVGIVRATVGRVSAQVRLALRNPPVASVRIIEDTVRLFLPSGSRDLTVIARDSEGASIQGAPFVWSTSAARLASVTPSGRVIAAAAGRADVVVFAEDAADTVVVLVEAPASPGAPQVTSTVPSVIAPGQTLVLNGEGFAASPGLNAVMIDGVPVAVSAASPQQLTLTLPPAAAFPCVPTGVVAVQVTTALGIGVGGVTLQVAPQRALAPGQSLILAGAAEARCVELAPADGRYLLTLQNVARALGSDSIAFTLVGAVSTIGGGAPTLRADIGGSYASADGMPRGATSVIGHAPGRRGDARAQAHLRTMARALAMPAPPPADLAVPGGRTASLQTPPVGAVVQVRVPNLGHPDFCANFTTIGARAVHVGPRVIILEDTMPTLDGAPIPRGTIDHLYAQLGDEVEQVIWPVAERFGNPLAMDSRLDANGRIVLTFTPRMNQLLGGAALAATVPCDFFSRAQQPSSNVGEFIYLQVPTLPGPGDGPGTPARWVRDIRGTIAHEMKHLVSFAERFARAQLLEDLWLEEATARIAEELFARAIYGTAQFGEHGFDATLRCEVGAGTCANAPRAMLPHVEGLWDFLVAPSGRSPLGPVTAADFSFYGSGWSLVRWAIDQGTLSETAFLTTLTTSGLRGVDNLEARSGRPWAELVGEWSLALATDGRPGFTPLSPRERFPSWDLGDLYAGLCGTVGACPGGDESHSRFFRPYPLLPAQRQIGNFATEFRAVLGGGFGVLELSGGGPSTRQLLHLVGYRGGVVPASARLAVVRVQ